jgi:hypothetical protein
VEAQTEHRAGNAVREQPVVTSQAMTDRWPNGKKTTQQRLHNNQPSHTLKQGRRQIAFGEAAGDRQDALAGHIGALGDLQSGGNIGAR